MTKIERQRLLDLANGYLRCADDLELASRNLRKGKGFSETRVYPAHLQGQAEALRRCAADLKGIAK